MKRFAIASFFVFLALSEGAAGLRAADPSPTTPRKARLHIVVSDALFATVNPTDASTSMKIWAKQIGTIRGLQFDTDVEVAPTAAVTRERLKDRAVDLLVLDTVDYVTLADTKLIEPLMAGTSRGRLPAYPYLLLTNDPSESGTLAALKGKRIVVVSRSKANLGLIWLETLLADNHLGRVVAFFGSAATSYRASSCVLALFFGKIDACVVDSGNLDALKELNPQLGKLRTLARSEPFIEGMLAMPVQPHPYKEELIESLLELRKTPAGEQLDLLFKTGPLTRVGKEAFETVAHLCASYRKLFGGDGAEPIVAKLDDAGKGNR